MFPGNDSVNSVDISSASEASGSYAEESKTNVEVGSLQKQYAAFGTLSTN